MEAKVSLGISAAIIIGVVVSTIFYNTNPANTSNITVGATSNVLRIGYFANLNHAQAVIGLNDGDFENTFSKNGIAVHPIVFNAGTSVIDALFANQIDVAYVGPNPAINGYVASEGRDVRIISGASSGGAVFVVRNDSGIKSAKDFAGKKFASPQLGNTQDVALRSYLMRNGYKTKENGGSVEVISTNLSDILTLFLKKQLDGAWVPEPWGAILVKEANGKIFLDERSLWPDGKFVMTNIIARTDYLKNNPDIIKKLLALHTNETLWINDHKNNAVQVFDTELKKLTGKAIPEDELKQALSRIDFTYDPIKKSFFKYASEAYNLGFLAKGQKQQPDLSGIYDLTLLNTILKEKGLREVN